MKKEKDTKKKKGNRTFIILDDMPNRNVELYKSLRTNLMFSSIDKKIKTIAVTSAGAGEGKSTCCVNLAMTLADAGLKVLIIDCDLRRPTIHKYFKMLKTPGLTDILTGQIAFNKAFSNPDKRYNLSILPCGLIPANPAEIIGSNHMDNFIQSIYDDYDYIIFDTPPAFIVTDSVVLSKYVDGVILVFSHGETPVNIALSVKKQFEAVNAHIIGTVLNNIPEGSVSGVATGYGKYGKYNSKYYRY